jgi:hypothetical protein
MAEVLPLRAVQLERELSAAGVAQRDRIDRNSQALEEHGQFSRFHEASSEPDRHEQSVRSWSRRVRL